LEPPSTKPRVAIRRKKSLFESSESKPSDENIQNNRATIVGEQPLELSSPEVQSVTSSTSKQSIFNRAFALIPFSYNDKNKPVAATNIATLTDNSSARNETVLTSSATSSKTNKLKSYFTSGKLSGSHRPKSTINPDFNANSLLTVEETSFSTTTNNQPVKEGEDKDIVDSLPTTPPLTRQASRKDSAASLSNLETIKSNSESSLLDAELQIVAENQIALIDKTFLNVSGRRYGSLLLTKYRFDFFTILDFFSRKFTKFHII
jgi:hypothetical protein